MYRFYQNQARKGAFTFDPNLDLFSFLYFLQATKCIIIHTAILLLKKNKDMIGAFSKLDGIAQVSYVFYQR